MNQYERCQRTRKNNQSYIECMDESGNIWRKRYHPQTNKDYYINMSKLDFAFACSGTVHLELSFSKIPHFIFYKANWINFLIFIIFTVFCEQCL